MSSLVPLSLCFHKHHSQPNFQPPILCPPRAHPPFSPAATMVLLAQRTCQQLGKLKALLLWVCLHYLKCLSISPVLYRVWLLSLVWIVWFNKWPPQWILWGGVLITTMKNILRYYRNLGSLRYGSSTVTEANKKLFWLSVRGRTLNVDFQGPDGAEQGFLAARQGGKARKALWPGLWTEWRVP